MNDALVDLTGLSPELVEAALKELEDQPKSLDDVRDQPHFLNDQKELAGN